MGRRLGNFGWHETMLVSFLLTIFLRCDHLFGGYDSGDEDHLISHDIEPMIEVNSGKVEYSELTSRCSSIERRWIPSVASCDNSSGFYNSVFVEVWKWIDAPPACSKVYMPFQSGWVGPSLLGPSSPSSLCSIDMSFASIGLTTKPYPEAWTPDAASLADKLSCHSFVGTTDSPWSD